MAEGGTVLFDEVADLPLALQAKLLRVLEERTLRRVGGATTFPVDVRFMAATNRNLKEAVARGEFREDLHFRLNVVTLIVPPLRERREDIVPLAERFIEQFAIALRQPARRLSASAQAMLTNYDFPGNIRELRNLIERAVLFCRQDTLETSHFPSEIQGELTSAASLSSTAQAIPSPTPDPLQIHLTFRLGEVSLADLEHRIIAKALQRAGGNKTLAAKYLGITRWTLNRRRKSSPLGE